MERNRLARTLRPARLPAIRQEKDNARQDHSFPTTATAQRGRRPSPSGRPARRRRRRGLPRLRTPHPRARQRPARRSPKPRRRSCWSAASALFGDQHVGRPLSSTDRSTPEGLAALAEQQGADVIVFCSDSHNRQRPRLDRQTPPSGCSKAARTPRSRSRRSTLAEGEKTINRNRRRRRRRRRCPPDR